MADKTKTLDQETAAVSAASNPDVIASSDGSLLRTSGDATVNRRGVMQWGPVANTIIAMCALATFVFMVLNDRAARNKTLVFEWQRTVVYDMLIKSAKRGDTSMGFENIQKDYITAASASMTPQIERKFLSDTELKRVLLDLITSGAIISPKVDHYAVAVSETHEDYTNTVAYFSNLHKKARRMEETQKVVFKLIADNGGTATLKDVERALFNQYHIPKTRAHSILLQLEQAGVIQRNTQGDEFRFFVLLQDYSTKRIPGADYNSGGLGAPEQ